MAVRKLSEISEGEIIKLKENGSLVDFYVAKHNYESGLNGEGRTLLVRKDMHSEQIWGVTTSNNYATSYIDEWLNDDYKNLLEANIQELISATKIYNNATSTLERAVFLLSAHEVGKIESWIEPAGTTLPNATIYQTANLDGFPATQWTRSRSKSNYYDIAYLTGTGGIYAKNGSHAYGIRPIFTLPSNLYMSDDGSVFQNTAPNSPGSITVPETIRGGEDASIIWSASTDPDRNLDGYIVERSYDGGSSWAQIYQGRSTSTTTTIPFGTETVMFRVQAYDTYGEKSGWRTSENKTVINNRAPVAPPSISVPLKPAGGEKLTVTWTVSTDADGNLEGYELERQWDGAGAFTQIYKGAALSFQDDIPKGTHSSVIYRVRAYDSFAAYSSYTTSPSRTIDNNTAPVISCDLSGDLGEKSEGFSVPYTVSDAEQQEVTVVERVGDLVKRTYKPTLGQQNTFEVTGEYFQRILNGAQTVQIVATDSAGKSFYAVLDLYEKGA